MSGLREFTWSARVLQFLPLAGALAVARRSIAASGLLLGWLLGYVVVKSAADVATVESGSYWRLIMPALPAFVLLSASVPLLVPTFLDRMGPRLAPLPGRRPGRRSTIAVVAFLAVVPIVAILLSDLALVTRQATPPRAYIVPELVVNEIGVPVDGAVIALDVRRVADANVLTWSDSTGRARTFYRVYRGSLSKGFSEMTCEPRGVRCDFRAETLVTTRNQTYVDRNPPPDAIYRVGVAANWLDDESRGDVFAISPPAAP